MHQMVHRHLNENMILQSSARKAGSLVQSYQCIKKQMAMVKEGPRFSFDLMWTRTPDARDGDLRGGVPYKD